jgi:hypothetical protein
MVSGTPPPLNSTVWLWLLDGERFGSWPLWQETVPISVSTKYQENVGLSRVTDVRPALAAQRRGPCRSANVQPDRPQGAELDDKVVPRSDGHWGYEGSGDDAIAGGQNRASFSQKRPDKLNCDRWRFLQHAAGDNLPGDLDNPPELSECKVSEFLSEDDATMKNVASQDRFDVVKRQVQIHQFDGRSEPGDVSGLAYPDGEFYLKGWMLPLTDVNRLANGDHGPICEITHNRTREPEMRLERGDVYPDLPSDGPGSSNQLCRPRGEKKPHARVNTGRRFAPVHGLSLPPRYIEKQIVPGYTRVLREKAVTTCR